MLPWAVLCTWGFHCLKLTPKMFSWCSEAWYGLKMPSFHKPEWAAHSCLGQSGHGGYITIATKPESGSCLLAKKNLLSKGTSSPMGVWSGFLWKPTLAFFHLGLPYAKCDAAHHLTNGHLAGPVCVKEVSLAWKSLQMFSLCVQKPDWAWKCLLYTSRK